MADWKKIRKKVGHATNKAIEKTGELADMASMHVKLKTLEAKRKEQEAARAAAAREYAEKHGVTVEQAIEKLPMSGVKDRPYCKGRAYDPDRYKTTEE